LVLVLAACSSPTELMLVVKAGPGLTFGNGGLVNGLRVQVQPAGQSTGVFFFTRSIDLCSPTEQGSPDCRPQQYASPDYDKALTLPVRLLLEPGSLGETDDVRIWVDALLGAEKKIAGGV